MIMIRQTRILALAALGLCLVGPAAPVAQQPPAAGAAQPPPPAAPGGGRQGGRGGFGGTQIQPGEECPPGTTEVRPRSCQAPSTPPPSIVDYRPTSTLVTAAHPVPKSKYPSIDFHGHPQRLLGLRREPREPDGARSTASTCG